MIQDMFEAIERGDYPVWDVFVQLMSPEEAEKYPWNIFDMTKVWPHKDFPLQQIGRLTMNRNVSLRHRSLVFMTMANWDSRETISPTLSKLRFPHRRWFRDSLPPLIQVSWQSPPILCSRISRSSLGPSPPSTTFRIPRRGPLPTRCELPATPDQCREDPSLLSFPAGRKDAIR